MIKSDSPKEIKEKLLADREKRYKDIEAQVHPKFCVAGNKFEMMALLAIMGDDYCFRGSSTEGYKGINVAFEYNELAATILRSWYKLTECYYNLEDENEIYKIFFDFIANALLTGELRSIYALLWQPEEKRSFGWPPDPTPSNDILGKESQTKTKVDTDEA